jgi:hypothetical protein
MEARDIRNLQRAYLDVYGEAFVDPVHEDNEIDEQEKKSYEPDPFGRPGGKYGGVPKKGSSYDKAIEANKKAIEALDRKKANEEVDLYGAILSHLLDEGLGGAKNEKDETRKTDRQTRMNASVGLPPEGLSSAGMRERIKKNQEERQREKQGKEFLEKHPRKKGTQREQVDLYDIILSHLLDEGYAETPEGAEVIMVNMSEDWREDILDEVYDADVMGSSQIRKTGEGGRVGAERKKSSAERRRVRAIGGGKTEPVEYKPRKDIGSQKQASTRVQQPTQARGSADVKARAAAAAREERIKAAKARIAAAKGAAPDTQAKPKAKEVSKQATQLLSTKKEKKPVSPDYTPAKASGHTASERMSITRAGETKLRGIMKAQELKKYKDITGENPTGKALTKVLARVNKRMTT